METNRKIERVLPCRLTPEEFVSRASDLAAADSEIDRAEVEAKEAAKAAKDKIGGLITRKNDLRSVVRDRSEPRRVSCTWNPDWASKSMVLRRDDTQEPVEVRTMTAEEPLPRHRRSWSATVRGRLASGALAGAWVTSCAAGPAVPACGLGTCDSPVGGRAAAVSWGWAVGTGLNLFTTL
jgi:hypothetical protein